MRLVTFADQNPRRRVGVLRDNAVFDLEASWPGSGPAPATMTEFLASGEAAISAAVNVVEQAKKRGIAPRALQDVRLLAPVDRPSKILCLAGNYQEHIVESRQQPVERSRVTPRVFWKPNTCILPPEGKILLPHVSNQVDWELELAAVIGKRGKYIPVEKAMDHVAGYTIFNDVSARSLVFAEGRDKREGDDFFDWLNGKWLDTFGPMGPSLVLKDEVPQPHSLRLKLKVNDEVKQDGNTAQMVFTIPEIVAFISQLVTLEPGDVISTGTPSGVGEASGTFLKEGDVVVGEVERLGTLRNIVARETQAAEA